MKKAIFTAVAVLMMVSSSFAQVGQINNDANVIIKKTAYVDGKRTIRVQSGEYNGIEYIDLREVFTGEDGKEKYTKKGFAIKRNQISKLCEALKQV